MSGFFKSNWRFGLAGGLIAIVVCLATTMAWAGLPPGSITNQSSSSTFNNLPPWPTNGPITIEQALQRALARDTRVASLNAAVELARQQRLAATDIKDPELQGESRSIGHSESASSDNLDDSRVSLGVYVPNPWLTVPRVNARTADYKAAQADLNAAIWLVKCDVRRLFAQIDYLTNDLAYSADRVRWGGEILKAVQARVGQGAATAADLMTASRQYLQFQNDFDQTYHSYQLARRQLASLLDVAPESLELATNSVAPPSLPETGLTFQQAEAMAVRSRSDLAALCWRARAAESGYHEIRNERVPWFKEVKAGYLDNSADNSDKYWIGLTMDVPIFSWAKNHAASAALARANLASVAETNGLRQICQELHDALDELDQTRRQVARNDTTMKPLVTTMRHTLATLDSTPNIMPEQVAAAELDLVEALRFGLNTSWQYELALLNLERTLGGPIDQKSVVAPAP